MKIFDLANLTATEGFYIDGAASGDNLGYSVSYAGDVNGDGIADVIVGAYNASPYGRTEAGYSYVIYGKKGGYPTPIDLATFNTTTTLGFRIDGESVRDWSGYSVSYAGDVNGDGLDDVIVGACRAAPHDRFRAGSSYVIYGKNGGYSAPIDLATFNTTTTLGFRIDGAKANDYSGSNVNTASDVNGDGIADVIIGVPYASPYGRSEAGSSYVVYGKKDGYKLPIDLAVFDSTIGFRINGAKSLDFSHVVNAAGDVNGDGIADVIVGAYNASPYGRSEAGSSYVVYGKIGGYSAPIDLATFNTTTTLGFRIDGAAIADNLGFSVSNAGDINGDGIADVIIGAYTASPYNRFTAGSSYAIYGKTGGYSAPIDLATLNNTNGLRIDGATTDDYLGYSVSYAGDVNGDSIADVIIGVPGALLSYAIYGKTGGYSAPIDLATFNTASAFGFRIDGAANIDGLGSSVSYAGDVNGDGIADVIVGAYNASPYGRTEAGSSYVVYGSYLPCNLINNTLILQYQNAAVHPASTLTTANLYAIDNFYHSNDSQIQFNITNLVAGKFELISSGQNITSFTQQQIKEGDVQFVQDGSPDLPAYVVSVANIKIATAPQAATVTFIAPPFVIGNIPNVLANVDTTFQNPINTTQIFKDSNYPIHFSATAANGSPLPEWVQFTMQDNITALLKSTAPLSTSLAGTTTTLSLIATNSYNLSSHVDFNVTVPKPNNSKYLTEIIAGGTAGGVVGLAALAGGVFSFWRYRKNKQFAEERKNYPFANVLREQLQLSGIDDFQSNAGLAFVNAIEVLINELQLQDIDVRNMYPNELDTLSIYAAKAIKTIVRISSTYFSIYKTVNPEDIQNHAVTIAKVTRELCQAPFNESNYGTFINS